MHYTFTPMRPINPIVRFSYFLGGYSPYLWLAITALLIALFGYLMVKRKNSKKKTKKAGPITCLILGVVTFIMACCSLQMPYFENYVYQVHNGVSTRMNNGNFFNQTLYVDDDDENNGTYDLANVAYNPYNNKFTVTPITNSGRTYYRVTSYLKDKVQNGNVITGIKSSITPNFTYMKFQDSEGHSSVLCSVKNSNATINDYNYKKSQNGSADLDDTDSYNPVDVNSLKEAKALKY